MSAQYRPVTPSDMASATPEKKPLDSAYGGGIGPMLRITEEQRQDAARAVAHRAVADGWDSAETVQVLDMLGLLPPKKLTGPRSVVCPTCSAVVGKPCTQNGGRDTYTRIHVARTKAAREAL